MTTDLKHFLDLKEQAEKLRSSLDRDLGALDQLNRRLQDEFGCEDLEGAEELLEKFQKREVEAQQQYEEALATFEERWAKQMERT